MMIRRREQWLIVSLTLVAFALRMSDLDARSLWLDDGFTLLRLDAAWSDVLTNAIVRQGVNTTDLHPPLYFLALKAWRELSGDSVFVLRLFSAFWATLIVPLTYILGRRLFASAGVGALAAGLAMLCPAYQWYAAEIRMYTLIAGLGAISSYLTYRVVRAAKSHFLWLAAWLSVTAASAFTHFSLISLAPVQAAFLIVFALSRVRQSSGVQISRRARLGIGLAAVALGGLLIVGAPTIARATQLAENALRAPRGQSVPPLEFLHNILGATVFGMNAGDPTGGWLIAFAGLLVLLGVCLPLSRRESMARLLLAVTICAPIIFWLGLSNLIENYPSFRYVIFIVPAIHVAIAHAVRAALSPGGIAIARRLSAWRVWQQALGSSSLIAVVGSTTFGLGMTFVRSPTWQDDWRGMAHYLRQQWQPGDAIVININTPEALLPLYLRDLPAPILTVNEWAAYPVEEVRRTITERYKRVWYANTGGDNSYQNPEAQAILRPYLLRSRIAFPARTTIIELLEYDLHPRVVEVLPATASVVDSVPTDRTVIAGYEVEPGNPYHPQANFRLALYWRRGTTDDPAKHSVAVRLAAHGRIWLDWTLPARLAHHPESWHAGTFYRMSYIVPVPPGLLPQSYTLELQVRSGDKNELVQAFSAALPRRDLDCCIRVARQADAEANPYWRARDVTLVRKEHPTLLRPGEPLPVALTWQAMRDDLVPWETRLMLKGLFGGEVAGVQRIVGSPDFPATAWPAGELMRDQYVLDVLRSTQPGWYCLQLERWRGGRRVDATFLGLVRVEDYPRALAAVQAQHPTTGARVGELSLLGYSVNAPLERGRTYDFITHWRVEQVPTRDGVLFLHMFGPDGRLVSQDDNPPIVDGTVRSTLTYRPGEHINQVHRLALPADAPAGEYRLLAGVYDREGGLRWPAQQDGRPARDDLILLGVIKLN